MFHEVLFIIIILINNTTMMMMISIVIITVKLLLQLKVRTTINDVVNCNNSNDYSNKKINHSNHCSDDNDNISTS